MEPPVIPTSRSRLTKDYTIDDDIPPAIKRYREGAPRGGPKGYDVDNAFDSPPRANGNYSRPEPHSRSNSREGQSASNRVRGLDRSNSYSSDLGPSNRPYQDHTSEHEQEDLRKLDFNLEPITEMANYEPSITSTTRSQVTETRSTALSASSGSRLPDFFSADVFQIVLHNPITSRQLLKFARQRLAAENMEYLSAVDRYQSLLNDVAKSLFEIHKSFISNNSAQQVNLPEPIMAKLTKDLKTSLSSTLPKLEGVFTDSQIDIENLVSSDIYPRFVRHQMTMSATRALATNKAKYAGLGDCFVLTDPSKADNPITFASDGFVTVTGYSRNEIIPRNCRFLQGCHTDRSSVRRLRNAIEGREESVELLLNERKDGEPFWNLLYVTPLRDQRGNIVFFLGGQINCSTTIHSQSDILRILAMTEDVEEQQPTPAPETQKSTSRYTRLLAGFKNKSNAVVPKQTPGMETGLLNRIEKMNLRKQMDSFYTAYSKFLVINASTFFIAFHSAGLTSLLALPAAVSPSYQPTQPSPIGQNAFTFLAAHAPGGSLPSGFKSKVKAAAKAGNAISVDTQLCTARYRGFEKFVVHWTPLKGGSVNGVEEVAWLVVTLGGGDQ